MVIQTLTWTYYFILNTYSDIKINMIVPETQYNHTILLNRVVSLDWSHNRWSKCWGRLANMTVVTMVIVCIGEIKSSQNLRPTDNPMDFIKPLAETDLLSGQKNETNQWNQSLKHSGVTHTNAHILR